MHIITILTAFTSSTQSLSTLNNPPAFLALLSSQQMSDFILSSGPVNQKGAGRPLKTTVDVSSHDFYTTHNAHPNQPPRHFIEGMEEEEGLLGCRRRKRPSSSNISPSNRHHRGKERYHSSTMAPRSFEHQIYITMARTGHRMAFLSRGLVSCFVSRLDGISNFCAIYSFTGILFTVSLCGTGACKNCIAKR